MFSFLEKLKNIFNTLFIKKQVTRPKTHEDSFPEYEYKSCEPVYNSEPDTNLENNLLDYDAKSDSEQKLLNNQPFLCLSEELVSMIDEFERYKEQVENHQAKDIIEIFIRRIYESLETSGMSRIVEDKEFAILRHTPVPMEIVKEGTPITETIIPGLCIGNRVFRKAKVIVAVQKMDVPLV